MQRLQIAHLPAVVELMDRDRWRPAGQEPSWGILQQACGRLGEDLEPISSGVWAVVWQALGGLSANSVRRLRTF